VGPAAAAGVFVRPGVSAHRQEEEEEQARSARDKEARSQRAASELEMERRNILNIMRYREPERGGLAPETPSARDDRQNLKNLQLSIKHLTNQTIGQETRSGLRAVNSLVEAILSFVIQSNRTMFSSHRTSSEPHSFRGRAFLISPRRPNVVFPSTPSSSSSSSSSCSNGRRGGREEGSAVGVAGGAGAPADPQRDEEEDPAADGQELDPPALRRRRRRRRRGVRRGPHAQVRGLCCVMVATCGSSPY